MPTNTFTMTHHAAGFGDDDELPLAIDVKYKDRTRRNWRLMSMDRVAASQDDSSECGLDVL